MVAGPLPIPLVVARYLNGDGFLITAYRTNKIKEGTLLWTP